MKIQKKVLLFLPLFIVFMYACSEAPPKKLRESSAGILMGGQFIATWNDNQVTPDSFFDSLSGENKKWGKGKGKDGIWYIEETQGEKSNPVTVRHYFVQNGSSTHMVYAKKTVNGENVPF